MKQFVFTIITLLFTNLSFASVSAYCTISKSYPFDYEQPTRTNESLIATTLQYNQTSQTTDIWNATFTHPQLPSYDVIYTINGNTQGSDSVLLSVVRRWDQYTVAQSWTKKHIAASSTVTFTNNDQDIEFQVTCRH